LVEVLGSHHWLSMPAWSGVAGAQRNAPRGVARRGGLKTIARPSYKLGARNRPAC
jgi:hypothetical protein